MSGGGSEGKSEGSSKSSGSSFIAPEQMPFLQNLWGSGQGMAGQTVGDSAAFGRTQGAELYGAGRANLPGQGGNPMARGAASDLISGKGFTDPGMLDPYIGAVGNDITAQLMRELGGAGGVGTGFGVGGTPGGGREQVARGIAMADAGRNFADIAGNARMTDLAQRRELMQTGIAQGGQVALGEGGLNLAQSQAYQSDLPGLLNLGLGGINAGWAPLLNYANVIGAPSILSQQQSKSKQWSQQSSGYGGVGASG